MQECRTCSTQNDVHYCARVVTVFTASGKPLPEPFDRCCHCDGSVEHGKVTVPSDQKLWLMADVDPNEYERRGETRQMKDWAQAEYDARLGKPQGDPDELAALEQAKERKRQQARELRTVGKTSLTPAERYQITEAFNRGVRMSDAGLVIP